MPGLGLWRFNSGETPWKQTSERCGGLDSARDKLDYHEHLTLSISRASSVA